MSRSLIKTVAGGGSSDGVVNSSSLVSGNLVLSRTESLGDVIYTKYD